MVFTNQRKNVVLWLRVNVKTLRLKITNQRKDVMSQDYESMQETLCLKMFEYQRMYQGRGYALTEPTCF